MVFFSEQACNKKRTPTDLQNAEYLKAFTQTLWVQLHTAAWCHRCRRTPRIISLYIAGLISTNTFGTATSGRIH